MPFYGARAGTSAFQSMFAGGRWQGALTWAFMTAREQWVFGSQGGHQVLSLSYAEMQRRIQLLLDALTFDQTVGLYTPPEKGEAAWPVFGTGPGWVDPTPDQSKFQIQVDLCPLIDLQLHAGALDLAKTGKFSGEPVAARLQRCEAVPTGVTRRG